MKSLFSMDNPFIQFLARVGDLMCVNALFLICSIPVFTLGASAVALRKVTQDMVCDEEKGILKTFFKAFRDNFRQSTVSWLFVLLFLVCMGCNLLLVQTYCAGVLASALRCLLIAAIILVLAETAYLFPLILRYDNTLREHAVNAGVLAVVKLPRTVALVALNVLPVLILMISPSTFLQTLVFWLTIGFGFTAYMGSVLLVPVFKEMEAPGGPAIQPMK